MEIQITDFTADHVNEALSIAIKNYEEERMLVPAMPCLNLPDLTELAGVGLGVAAFDNVNMLGFMCSVPLIDRPFQIKNILGAYVPLHAHGAVKDNRENIYALMYEAAASKWVNVGALNHAITLYAHDSAAINQFFRLRDSVLTVLTL